MRPDGRYDDRTGEIYQKQANFLAGRPAMQASTLLVVLSMIVSLHTPAARAGDSEGVEGADAAGLIGAPESEVEELKQGRPGGAEPSEASAAPRKASGPQPPSGRETPDIWFKPGLRIQGRYTHEDEGGDHDFFLRRIRLKGSAGAFGIVKAGVEIKIDSVGKSASAPKAVLENAWLEFAPMSGANLRAGLYDLPFSRAALTSDSKLLLMDRGIVKDALTDFGLADNTIGVLAHGRPFGGRLEYALGVFDNNKFDKLGGAGTRQSGKLMPAGRFVLHLLDPAPAGGYGDYRGSYLGAGQRLEIGANSAYLGGASDGPDEFNLVAWGTDLFFNKGGFSLQSEYDRFKRGGNSGRPSAVTNGWYVQAGYLLEDLLKSILPGRLPIELAARYQELDADDGPNGRLQWTSLGLNYYIRGHHLKIQAEYTFKREETASSNNDMVQLQLQLDF